MMVVNVENNTTLKSNRKGKPSMNAVNDTLRKFAARGLLPLSFLAAVVTGDPAAQAYETPQEIVIEQQSIDVADDTREKATFGAQLFTPAVFEDTTGMWVGRDLTTTRKGQGEIPQLHEYFATDDNRLFRTTVTSAGKSAMTIERTESLPPKVVQSLRDNIPSMTPKMVFEHFA